MTNFWKEKRVLVTGGAGFIGSHLVEKLADSSATVRVADNFSRGSLPNLGKVSGVEIMSVDLSEMSNCIDACRDIDVVFSLAARVSGIQFNQSHSADMLRINSRISLNTLEAARITNVERFLTISSACVYSRSCSIPTPESEGFLEEPEPTNWGYGWAKRFSEIQAIAYGSQYGMKVGIVRPYNTYGPRDDFSTSEAHVIPALIAKMLRRADSLSVWGSGNQTRSFVYVKDVVRGMMQAAELYPKPDPLNIGSDEEVSIRQLVNLISAVLNKHPHVSFDTTHPDGHERRRPDVSKAAELIGFKADTPLERGLEETVAWARTQLHLLEA